MVEVILRPDVQSSRTGIILRADIATQEICFRGQHGAAQRFGNCPAALTLSMPYISTEALVGAALLVVLAFGYQYIPKAGAEVKKKTKRKNKKVSGGTATSEPESTSSKKGKKRKPTKQGRAATNGRAGSDEEVESVERQGGPSLETSAASNGAPSFAAVAGGSSTNKVKPKTLAEKIAPKARKTKVDE